MVTYDRKIVVLVNTNTFENLLKNEKVAEFYKNFGLSTLLKTFYIDKNKMHSLDLNATYSEQFDKKTLDSNNVIFFQKGYNSSQKINSFQSENGLISRLNLDDKFIKICNSDGLFYIQNIYSLIGIPNKAKELLKNVELPQMKSKTDKLYFSL